MVRKYVSKHGRGACEQRCKVVGFKIYIILYIYNNNYHPLLLTTFSLIGGYTMFAYILTTHVISEIPADYSISYLYSASM